MPVFPLSLPNKNGLIAWWTFDAGTGEDTSGFANQGVLTNTPICVPGFVRKHGENGSGLRFNGSNNYVISNKLINQARVTLSIWVKRNGTPALRGHLCGFANGIGNATADKNVLLTTGGAVQFYVFDGSAKSITGTKVITDDQWHHVVATADGTNYKIYIDGVEDATGLAGNTFTGYSVPNLIVNGAANGNQSGTYVACDMDDFRLYNRGLSAVEVNALYLEALADRWENELPALYNPPAGFFSRYYYDLRAA